MRLWAFLAVGLLGLTGCGSDSAVDTAGGGGGAQGGSGGSSAGTGGASASGGSGGAGASDAAAGSGGLAGFANQKELAWDDGSAEQANSPWSDQAGGQIATCFTPPAYPARVEKARFYVVVPDSVAGPVGISTTPFRARVYAADASGAPGTDLLAATVTGAAKVGNEWVTTSFTTEDVIVASGDFCVAMEWTTAPGNDGTKAQFLGTDTSAPDTKSWWNQGSWTPIASVANAGPRDAMIRATVTY